MTLRLVVATMLVNAMLPPTSASAEERNALPRPYGRTIGMTWELALTANGLTDSSFLNDLHYFDGDININPLVGLSVAGLYRPISYVSVGLVAHLSFLAADVEDVADDVAGVFAPLIEVRGHLPVGRVDPWLGFGIGYLLAYGLGRGGEGALEGVDFDFRWTLHGLGLGMSVGLNVFLSRNIALTPFFRMLFGVYPGGCYAVHVESLVDDEECAELEEIFGENFDDLPHLWNIGIGLHFVSS